MYVRCVKNIKDPFSAFFHLPLLLLFLALTACNTNEYIQGNGLPATVERVLPSFNAIDIQGNYEVILIQSHKYELEIKADENIIPYISSEVAGNTLKVYNTGKIKGNENIKLNIYYQNINSINCGGASSIKCSSLLKETDIVISMTGTGLMDLELEAQTLELHLSGTGLINLAGEVEKEDIKLSGAGKLNASNLKSKDCNIDLSGIGSAMIHVENHLNAQISGVGGIKYKGNPASVKREIAGIGTILSEND